MEVDLVGQLVIKNDFNVRGYADEVLKAYLALVCIIMSLYLHHTHFFDMRSEATLNLPPFGVI